MKLFQTEEVQKIYLLTEELEKVQNKLNKLNIKAAELLTSSVVDKNESSIKKFRSVKKEIVKLLDKRILLSKQIVKV